MNRGEKSIRFFQEDDTQEIADIYFPYILNTHVSFEYEIPDLTAFKQRLSSIANENPFLIGTFGDRITGYANATTFRYRTAYHWSRELSVYISEDFQHLGWGKALYSALMEILTGQGYKQFVAGISLPGPGSVRFHENIGFKKVGEIKDVGYKFGNYYSIGFWQISVRENYDRTDFPVHFRDLDEEEIKKAFEMGLSQLRSIG